MGKFLTVLVASILSANNCFALGLELADIIKEAREAERMKLSQNQMNEKSIQPVQNNHNNKQITGEQNACEKINPKEILDKK